MQAAHAQKVILKARPFWQSKLLQTFLFKLKKYEAALDFHVDTANSFRTQVIALFVTAGVTLGQVAAKRSSFTD